MKSKIVTTQKPGSSMWKGNEKDKVMEDRQLKRVGVTASAMKWVSEDNESYRRQDSVDSEKKRKKNPTELHVVSSERVYKYVFL